MVLVWSGLCELRGAGLGDTQGLKWGPEKTARGRYEKKPIIILCSVTHSLNKVQVTPLFCKTKQPVRSYSGLLNQYQLDCDQTLAEKT